MISDISGKKRIEYVPDYVIFDLETTGISCTSDEVVEISAVKVEGGVVVDEFTTLVNPGRPIPYQATSVHGITDEMVENSPMFREALADFNDFIGDSVIVGHNIHNFDMNFIQRDTQKYFGKYIGNDYIDTLEIARLYLPELPGRSLVELADHYGIESQGAHRALNDCRMNQQVFECLRREIENPSEAAKAVKRCPKCGNAMKKRKGRFGEFWGCVSYPECRYTENV